jgi:hypothetical protein
MLDGRRARQWEEPVKNSALDLPTIGNVSLYGDLRQG